MSRKPKNVDEPFSPEQLERLETKGDKDVQLQRQKEGMFQRNRAKRRLRACITPMLPSLKKGRNLIFIARRDVLTIPFAEMQKQMEDVIRRAGLWENNPS